MEDKKITEIPDLNPGCPNAEKKFSELGRGASSYVQEIHVPNTSQMLYERNMRLCTWRHIFAQAKIKGEGDLKFRTLHIMDCYMDNF